jgi:hypothetical protein
MANAESVQIDTISTSNGNAQMYLFSAETTTPTTETAFHVIPDISSTKVYVSTNPNKSHVINTVIPIKLHVKNVTKAIN